MQDPSQGVALQLKNHVHLISAHQFPLVAQLHVEQAFRYLIDGPVIVKSTAPMSWTYVNMPGDGTIWLEWLSPSRQNHLASDGYIWGEPESTQHVETQGYTIEIMRHNLGYRPGLDPIASHARTRYHFIQKAPHVPAAAPDPSLWIVHYHQAQHAHILPVQQVPVSPQTRQMMHERQLLQSQGRLEKRDFMLHDREHWPHIKGPTGAQMGQNMMQPGFYGSNPMPLGQQGRYNQPQYNQYQGQQPPNKRPRTGTMTGPGAPEVPDTSVEDEENTALGDYFDHLTPRDISMARYQQHHRWMEEVFSSPYATGQIVPADLGLGLMGELKPLTEGILDPPTTDFAQPIDKSGKPQEAPAFTNLSRDQVDEFNKRVQKHLEDGQAEIERMKADHAAKMQEWRKTKTLLQAEKRLRFATWEGHDAATAVYRLDEPATNGQSAPVTKETVEDVVKDVENLLGVKFTERKVSTLVDKGGLEEKEELPPPPPPMDQTMQDIHANQQSNLQPGGIDFRQSASPLPQSNPTYMPPSVPQSNPSPVSQQQQQYQPPAQQQAQAQQSQQSAPTQQLQMPEGMDLDPTDFKFDSPSAGATPASNTAAPGPTATQPPAQQQQTYNPTLADSTNNNNNTAQQQQDTLPDPDPLQDDSMFADSFNDFTTGGLDDDGNGDGLIDFDAGGVGLEDSAFGDALHGMDDGDGDDGGDGEMFGGSAGA